MNGYDADKKYEAFKIPDRQQAQENGAAGVLPQAVTNTPVPFSDGLFYEIEYDSCPMEGVGKFVLKSQKIGQPVKDKIRDLFYQMRDIARQHYSPHVDFSRFYDKRARQDNARIFYKQAMFMKDFEDDYTEQVPFSSYFPYYQMLSYEQLRTYFTWRTQVRKGNVSNTSLSYVFLYIYELLNNAGVDSPQDGLDRLMSFWNAFKAHGRSIDRYVLRWLKDYHIYYNLPQAFKDFAEEHNLTEHYPKMADLEKNFDLFCAISKYDIRKSAFYTDETSKLITDCFYFVMDKLRQAFGDVNIPFDDAIFKPTKKMTAWSPFKDALFYPCFKQPDRGVVLSENEIYICSKNEWTFNTSITSEIGRQFIGYVMKQMESVLRKATKYKLKLVANINTINQAAIEKMKELDLSLEKIINNAVMEFYREATKTVVAVDHISLTRIREEALSTQEKLTVAENAEQNESGSLLPEEKPFLHAAASAAPAATEPLSLSGGWEKLKAGLNETELQALAVILQGEMNIKKFADDNGVMLEVLADGINEKAMDHIRDNLLDDEMEIYENYEEQIRGMVDLL